MVCGKCVINLVHTVLTSLPLLRSHTATIAAHPSRTSPRRSSITRPPQLCFASQPTQQEREQALGGKWVRKGLWWFRFEVRVNNDGGKAIGLGAPKDASNHTFAAETATNWGWQKFATRDSLFKHPLIEQNDYFTIICTITSQPQPPAGHWLGLGIPQRASDKPTVMGWTGSEGASGGVGGGTYAAGGPKKVIPRDLVTAVGDMLDDPRE